MPTTVKRRSAEASFADIDGGFSAYAYRTKKIPFKQKEFQLSELVLDELPH
jgi:hypothetical protein